MSEFLPEAFPIKPLGSCHVWLAVGGIPKGREVVQECGLGLIHIRRTPERLSFVAPKLIRSGPIEPEVLARVVRGLDLAPHAVLAANWVDNGSGWLAIMLRSREEVLALRPNYSTLTGLKVGAFAAFNPLKDGTSAQFEVCRRTSVPLSLMAQSLKLDFNIC